LRRGRKSDPEWINRRQLLRAAERLTDEQRTRLFEQLTSADPNGDIAAAWIAKELLRDVLACTARGGLRYEITAALYAFYAFCAACSVPEIGKLAETISAWQEPMILAIETGLSNPTLAVRATTESSNTSVGSPSDSEHQRINAAGYGGPAPANHGERHPVPDSSAPANSEEPR
jgi:hypothetical protein